MSSEYCPASDGSQLNSSARTSYSKVSDFTHVQDQLPYTANRDTVRASAPDTTVTSKPSILDISNRDSPKNTQDSLRGTLTEQHQFVKLESNEGTKPLGEAVRYEGDSVPDQNITPEEPLEIQCGENTALLYVSKLCQGSKGPCILYKNSEWLTPNELQYISGRETAKDWKRSIRFKGKSLKSLIARGLIKVHPPICDCLGCRISSPVNRGRLASKCSLSPTSPLKRKDSFRSSPAWRAEGLDTGISHRHFSTPDLDHLNSTSRNGIHDLGSSRESSSSTSECSEPGDDCPFSPISKRPRSSSPENLEKAAAVVRRRASESSLAFFQNAVARDRLHYNVSSGPLLLRHTSQECHHPNGNSSSAQAQQGHITNSEEIDKLAHNREQQPDTPDSRSAFRTVFQDGVPVSYVDPPGGQMNTSEGLPNEIAMRSSKARGKPSRLPSTSFVPPFTQSVPAVTLVSPAHNSPRLVPDSVFLSNPHAANIYHHAMRTGYPGISSIPQSLLHYRLLSPTAVAQQAQAQAAMAQSLSLQNALIPPDPGKLGFAANQLVSSHPLVEPARPPKSPNHSESSNRKNGFDRNVSSKEERVESLVHSNDITHKSEANESMMREERKTSSDTSANEHAQDRESVIQRSPVNSPGTPDEQPSLSLQKQSASIRDIRTNLAQQLMPRVQVELNTNVFKWTVDDVCHFVMTLTECPEIERVFREHHIDGQALVLLREDHLLNRMAIRLGPALKVLAQVEKLLDSLQRDDVST